MRKGKEERKLKFKIQNLIFIYIVTVVIITSFTLSRYETTAVGKNTTTVAVMANTVSTGIQLNLAGFPGSDSTVCPIIITNEDNNTICDVAQSFTVEISRQENANLPLVCNLYSDEYCTQPIQKDENGLYISDDFNFSPGIKQTKECYLKIDWPEEENDDLYAFEIEYIKIKVVATQID